MKRLHVHVAVKDLDESIRFYATLFGHAPTVHKPDYAKWMLDDPRVNFAISTRGGNVGLDHLGIQAESAAELDEISDRLAAANRTVLKQENTTCCYARSDKAWITDPAGLDWETFHSFGEATTYGEGRVEAEAGPTTASAACCAPAESGQANAGKCGNSARADAAPASACC
ncbi:MAG: VOC family protein [Proteobacteria bacterium]|nr:VOC family protein [Pseudomonadota bacterium]